MGRNFWDFLSAPWHALESLGGKIIDAPRALIHEPLTTFSHLGDNAAGVLTSTVNAAGSTVQHLGGDLRGTVGDTAHELHGAAADVSQNMILPLSIGAGVLAVMFMMKK